MDSERYGLLITGENVTTIDQDKVKAAFLLLDHKGIDVQIIPVPESLDEKRETETSPHYAEFDDFRRFAESHPDYDSKQLPGRLWSQLMMQSGARDSDEPKRGKLMIGDHELELFRFTDFATEGYEAYARDRSHGYEINLDSLLLLAKKGCLSQFPNLGKKTEKFVLEFIEARLTGQ